VADPAAHPPADDRRAFLAAASSAALAAGLAGGYGTLGAMALAYLYPAHGRRMGWLFVAEVARVAPKSSIAWRAPSGEAIAIARKTDSGTAEDFVALSSTCPHLGCQVHWEGPKERFFCPCHNGVFDPEGKGVSGPPGDAGQSLARFNLKIEDGLLYIEVPLERLV
jgi:Rieske Fe-S protein